MLGIVALSLACTASMSSQAGDSPRPLIERLPAGAAAIAWVDFAALIEATPPEKWAEYERMLQDDEDLRRFEAVTGIDPRADLHGMGVAIVPGDGPREEVIALISVDHDRERLDALLVGAETLEHGGVVIYSTDEVGSRYAEAAAAAGMAAPDVDSETSADDDDPAYLALLDGGTVAIGTLAGLQAVIDVEGGGREALAADAAMSDRIAEVAGYGQTWMVATRSAWDDRMADLDAGGAGAMVPSNAIERIETVTLAMRYADGISMRMTGITGTPEDAALLAESLNGWIAMAKMMVQASEPELFAIFDSAVRAGHDDRTVHIEIALTEADVEVLQRRIEKQMGNAAAETRR